MSKLNCLQWSHGPSAMDTRCRASCWATPQTLQWSHGPSAMDTTQAQMRHLRHRQPSMEPWPFSHGYLPWRAPGPAFPPPFNGAMALQPWIPAYACLALGHSLSTFNGAMALQPWIRQYLEVNFNIYHAPSMEPWPFSHGYSGITGIIAPVCPIRARISGSEAPFTIQSLHYSWHSPPSVQITCERSPSKARTTGPLAFRRQPQDPRPANACQRALKRPKPPFVWAGPGGPMFGPRRRPAPRQDRCR